MYLIVAKAVPFAASVALSYLTTLHSAILIRSQLEYDGGRAYTDAGHVFILALQSAVLPGPSCELCSAGYVSPSLSQCPLSMKWPKDNYKSLY